MNIADLDYELAEDEDMDLEFAVERFKDSLDTTKRWLEVLRAARRRKAQREESDDTTRR